MNKKALSNSKMGKIVARLLGKPELAVKDGKVELSTEERAKVLENYGQAFLEKLESVTLEDEDAFDLFDAAVAAKTAEATAALTAQVKQLQGDVLELSREPEPQPKAQTPSKPLSAGEATRQFVLNMSAAHNKIVAQALASTNPMAFAALDSSTLDVADLNTEFKIVMPPKAKLDLLAKRLYMGFNDSKHMTRIQSDRDFIASAAIFTEVSQQFTPKWTPKGTAKFTPIRIPYRRHKINVLIRPTDIIKSWLLNLYEQGKTQAEMPITKYIIEEHILPKTLDDITLSMIGKGKFKEVSLAGLTDGTDEDCKINYLRAAKDYRTLSDEELLKYVDSFVDNISGLFAKTAVVFCSEQFRTRYKRADFAVNGKYTGIENGDTIRFTNFHLVALESMYNSPILFATPKENFVELVDYSKAESCINRIEESNYDVKVFGEYSLSVGFKIAEAVFAAVPTGYTPSESILSEGIDLTEGGPWMNGVKPASQDSEQKAAGDSGQSGQEGA